MRKKTAVLPNQTETDDQVRLKPVMGIRPGVWLTVLYSIILLGVLFFLLAFPGLINPGAALLIKTEPAGAAIRVDGVYMGTSGSADKIFVSKGTHTLEAVLPGFETASAVYEIPGRIFGSLFFPLRCPVEFTLETGDPAAAFAGAIADFAAWSFGGEPTAVWQIPLSLSEGAYRTGPENDPAVEELLQAASRFTVTRAALRDLVRAKIFLDSGGLSPSPAGLTDSISDILLFLSENPGSAEWLSGLLPPESAAVVRASNWYKSEFSAETHILPGSDTGVPAAGRFELAGLFFTGIPAGTLVSGGFISSSAPFPHSADIKNFMISENPVPRTLFETFLNENPLWREEQSDLYPAEIYERVEITGISWFAAEAFCQWLTKRLPASMAAMEVRLPTEAEWEYAAKTGIVNMGNSARAGWEWCADPFVPLPFIKVSNKAAQTAGSPERSLRGRPSPASAETRASLPPDFSSPFVTFRPVIAEMANEK